MWGPALLDPLVWEAYGRSSEKGSMLSRLAGCGILIAVSVNVLCTVTNDDSPHSEPQHGFFEIEVLPDLSRLQQLDSEWLEPSKQSHRPAQIFPASANTNKMAANRFSISLAKYGLRRQLCQAISLTSNFCDYLFSDAESRENACQHVFCCCLARDLAEVF